MDANNGVTDSVITDIAPLCENLFAGTNMGSIFYSSDSGMSWMLDTLFFNYTVTSFAQVGTYIFVGTEGAMFFSADSGKSWKESDGIRGLIINSILAYNGILFATVFYGYGSGGAVMISTDTGATWLGVAQGIEVEGFGPILAYGDYLIAGAFYQEQTGIWRRPLTQLLPGPAYITVLPDTLNFGGQYYFTDSILNCWVYDGGSGIDTIDSVRIIGADSSDFYLVQYPQSIIFPLLVGPEDTLALPITYLLPQIPGTDTATLEIFYSHSKDSVLTVHLTGSSVTDDVSKQPIEIISNATANPNPTTSETVISFGVSQEAYIKIQLFDVLGQEVSSVSGESLFEPGNTSVPISLAGLPGGTYYARIMTNYGEVQTVKIVKQ
jgi:hypothetical protein